MAEYVTTPKSRAAYHAKRRATELARRATLSDTDAATEIADAVHLTPEGRVEVFVTNNAGERRITAITVAEFIPTWRTLVN